MDADSVKTGRIQGAHTDIPEDIDCEDGSETNSFCSATSNLGFVSASLHVPSYGPPPTDDPPTGLHIIQDHNERHPGAGPNMHHVIKHNTAEKCSPAIMEGRGDVGVILNSSNHTNLREVTGTITRETQINKNGGAATDITTTCNTLKHEHINTTVYKNSSLPCNRVVRDPPTDEDGYDTIEYNTSKDNKDPQHDYDTVFFKQEKPDNIPVEHNYEILENEKKQHKYYTTAKTHTLVVSNENSDGSKDCILDMHGIVVEAGGSSDSVTNSKEPNKSGFLKYSGSSSIEGSRTMPNTTKPHERKEVDTILEGQHLLPRGTAYPTELKSASAGPSNIEASMNNLFDDPAYDTVDSTKSAQQISMTYSSISETSRVPEPSTCGFRQNEVQEFDYKSNGGLDSDLTGGWLSKVHGIDCEMAEDFQPGDISELEPSMTGNALTQSASALPYCSSGRGRESEDQETLIPSYRETFELTPKPTTGGSCDTIYESQILNLNSKPHSHNEQYEMKARTLSGHSCDMYAPTSHKSSHNTTPSSMFDDPMYGFGLNLSKAEDR